MRPSVEPPTVDQLRGLALFSGLHEDALDLLCARLEQRVLKAGDVLFRQGDRGRELYVLLTGSLRHERLCAQGELVARLVEPGDWVGEMSMLDVMPRPASAVATTDATVLRLDNRTLDCVYRHDLKQYALLVMNLARQLSRKLRDAEDRLCSLVQYPER